MNIRYHISDLLAQKSVDGKRNFLLTNRAGSYFYHNLDTMHGGWFVRDQQELFRVLAEIRIAAPKVSAIIHKLYAIEQHRNKLRETFFLPFKENALVYKTSVPQSIDLVFDVRKSVDDGKDRFYDVSFEDGCTIIRFIKKSEPELTFFVAVNLIGKALNRWEKRSYAGSARAVCRAVRFSASQLVITAGTDRVKVLRDNARVAENLSSLVAVQRKYASTFAHDTLETSEIANRNPTAFDRCIAGFALDSLADFTSPALLSGIPSFSVINIHELISARALLLHGDKKIIWNILFRQLRSLQPDGLLPSGGTNLVASDASGWLFLRVYDFMRVHPLTKEQRTLVEMKLATVIDKQRQRNSKNGLAWHHCTDGRASATIEMQALRLAMYQFAFHLTKNRLYQEYERQLRMNVRDLFWNGAQLADGLADFTARPTIFLAAYIYPELLGKDEWKSCFIHLLDKLWSEKEGITTAGIALEPQASSDRLLWMNNIAAIVMHRIDKEFFKYYIDKIYSSSRDEMLWDGCVGMSALSSESSGDAAALSAATFIELSEELN